MTMQSKVSKAVFNGNGATTDFPFDFKVWDTSELSVTITGPDGASIPATGWTATLTDTGGTVSYRKDGAPLPSGWKLAILRDMPFRQGVDLLSGTRFDPQVIETSLDQACAERQQLLEQLQRSVILPPTSDETPLKMAEQILQAEKTAQASAAAAQASESAAASSASQSAASAQAAAASAEAADQSRAAAATSAADASQSSTAASQSAEAAAGSEDRAAQSAASILGLQVEVATLDPSLPASGDYDPETGILHLGIPKGDSGASAIATPTSLGSVMPQTGDDDGLELTSDGTLRVRKATATQRGSVLASETAKAGAAPLGGADGSLGEDWLKKAMVAAAEAKAAADKAQSTADNISIPASYIRDTYKAADGRSWALRFSDGFILQGGMIAAGASGTVTFNYEYTKKPVVVGVPTNPPQNNLWAYQLFPLTVNTTGLTMDTNTNIPGDRMWIAAGY